jgi:DNA-directed RNA polymerase alpha subunit
MKENDFNDKLRKLFETVKNNYSEISKACKACEKQFLKAENDGISYKDAYAQWELLQAIRGLVRSTDSLTSDFVSNFANNSYLKDFVHESLLHAAYKQEKKYSNYLLKHPEAKEVKVNEDTLNFLRMRIKDVDLTVRTLNVMRAADINIMADIAVEDKNYFLAFRNFWKGSLKELEDILSSHGVHFDYLLRYDEETKEYYTIA